MIVNCLKCAEFENNNGRYYCRYKGIIMKSPYYIDKEIEIKDEFGNILCNFHEKQKNKDVIRNLDDYLEILSLNFDKE